MTQDEVKTMVRCLIGNGTEQEKIAIIGAIGRGLLGAGKRLVSKPGKLYKTKAGKMVRGPRQFSPTRTMVTGFGVLPGVAAGMQAAKAHPKAYRMRQGQLS